MNEHGKCEGRDPSCPVSAPAPAPAPALARRALPARSPRIHAAARRTWCARGGSSPMAQRSHAVQWLKGRMQVEGHTDCVNAIALSKCARWVGPSPHARPA